MTTLQYPTEGVEVPDEVILRSMNRSVLRHEPRPKAILIGIKGTVDLRKRLRMAAVEETMTYAELLDALLDLREDRRKRQLSQQPHPLARPSEAVSM